MRRIPTPDARAYRRAVHELESQELSELAGWAAGRGALRVIARAHREPGDERVFAAIAAGQRIDHEPWLVRAVLRWNEGRAPQLRRVTVEHFSDPAREVTGALLRELRLAAIRDRALDRLEIGAEVRDRLAARGLISDAEAASARKAAQHARGPRGAYPVDHYRRIAVRYLELVEAGRTDIVNALCDEERRRLREAVPRERVRGWIRKATDLGFLSPGTRGRAGRKPGPNLKLTKENSDG